MARRKSPAEPADLDVMNVPGNDDPDVIRDGVAVRVGGPEDARMATFWPVSFDRLEADARDLAELVSEWVTERRHLAQRIDATVPALREHGLSWGQIGYLVGMSDEGARQRWGGDV